MDNTTKQFTEFKKWKSEHLKEYNTKQIEILRDIKKDMIFKNSQSFIDFVRVVFGYLYEIRFFIDVYVMKKEINIKDLWNDIKNYI